MEQSQDQYVKFQYLAELNFSLELVNVFLYAKQQSGIEYNFEQIFQGEHFSFLL
jgi:hypothetical protein